MYDMVSENIFNLVVFEKIPTTSYFILHTQALDQCRTLNTLCTPPTHHPKLFNRPIFGRRDKGEGINKV